MSGPPLAVPESRSVQGSREVERVKVRDCDFDGWQGTLLARMEAVLVGRRRVPIASVLRDYLVEHRMRQGRAGPCLRPHGYPTFRAGDTAETR
jgi:hypothetical protein